MSLKEEGIEKMCDSLNKFYAKRPFEKLGRMSRRLRVIEEQKGKCLWCGLLAWQGAEIVFELDHIDGDRSNAARTNLRALCPNCHSQTPTFRMKNRKSIRGQ